MYSITQLLIKFLFTLNECASFVLVCSHAEALVCVITALFSSFHPASNVKQCNSPNICWKKHFCFSLMSLLPNNTRICFVLIFSSFMLDVYFAAELFVNGEIVQRSPERQRRVEPQPQRAQDRPRYNDRTRYVRRRENTRWNTKSWRAECINLWSMGMKARFMICRKSSYSLWYEHA